MMRFRRDNVNSPSRSFVWVRHLGAILLFSALTASLAHADRVVVLPASGGSDAAVRSEVDEHVRGALEALAHVPVAPSSVPANVTSLTAADLQSIATTESAEWVLVPVVHDSSVASYWVTLRAGYGSQGRVEELDAEVRRTTQDARLRALLSAMLRPEGLSEDGYLLAGEDAQGRTAEDAAAAAAEAERLRLAEEQAAREAEEEAARLAAAEAAAAEEAARLEREAAEQAASEEAQAARFAARDRYGVADGLTMVQLGGAVRPLLSTGTGGAGGVMATLELRAGRGFESIPGLELRGGVDLFFGAARALTLHVGAAYFISPFEFPLHFGATVEVGLFGTLSGNRGAGFMTRASLLASYNLVGGLYAEVSLPEFMWISNSGGAISLGAAARLGLRF